MLTRNACAQALLVALFAALLVSSSACSSEKTDALPDLPNLALDRMAPPVRVQVQQAQREARQNLADANANGRLGMVLHAYTQLEAAETCYQRASLLGPNEFRWAYYLGTVRFLLGDDAGAITALQKALRLDPTYPPAQLRLAEAYLDSGELEPAFHMYRNVVEKHPRLAMAHYGLGQVEMARQGAAEAIKHYQRACEISPQFGAAHYALAQAYRQLDDNEKSEVHLSLYQKHQSSEQPIEDSLLYAVSELKTGELSGSATDHFKRGLSLADAGNLPQAVDEFERALEINPDLMQAHINLISLYASLGQKQKAADQYRIALKADPKHADLHFNFGVLMAEEQNHDEAEKAFRETLEIEPNHAAAHNNLGQMLESRGRLDEAMGHYRLAVRHQPEYRLAHFHLGRMLLTQGKTDEGLQHFLRTLTPEDEETPRYLLDVAVAFARAGDFEKAVQYAQQSRERAGVLGQTEVTQLAQAMLHKLQQEAKQNPGRQ